MELKLKFLGMTCRNKLVEGYDYDCYVKDFEYFKVIEKVQVLVFSDQFNQHWSLKLWVDEEERVLAGMGHGRYELKKEVVPFDRVPTKDIVINLKVRQYADLGYIIDDFADDYIKNEIFTFSEIGGYVYINPEIQFRFS